MHPQHQMNFAKGQKTHDFSHLSTFVDEEDSKNQLPDNQIRKNSTKKSKMYRMF
jgi:hypothetical protein